jgi:hypothetical protein
MKIAYSQEEVNKVEEDWYRNDLYKPQLRDSYGILYLLWPSPS